MRLLPSSEEAQQVQIGSLIAYTAIWSAVHWLRAARWHLLLDPIAKVGSRKILGASWVGFLAVMILPLRTGELVRPALVRKKGVLRGWEAVGTVAAERIIDGLVLCLLLLLGHSLSTIRPDLPTQFGALKISPGSIVPLSQLFCLAFCGAFIAMMLLRYYQGRLDTLILSFPGLGLGSRAWFLERLKRVAIGFDFLSSVKRTASFFLLTIAYWLLNAWASLLLAHGCGLHDIHLAESLVITGVLALGILLPNAPGFVGAFQLSVSLSLLLFLPESMVLKQGEVFVFWLYSLQMAISIIGAMIGFALLQFRLTPEADTDALE